MFTTRNLQIGVDVKYFDLAFNGQNIHYGAKRLSEFIINIGTYIASCATVKCSKNFKAPPPNCEKANRCCGAWDTSTEYPCLCSRRAHKVRLPGNACQPEPSSPVRTAYSVWRSVFADLGIAFFDTGTAP